MRNSSTSLGQTELNFWIDYIQDDATGGSGYDAPGNVWAYSYVARTGALLVEQYYVGDTKDTPRVQAAANFINSNWGASGPYGNLGQYYAMYAVFKGLELLHITTLPLRSGALDWYSDYTDYLVAAQLASGEWPNQVWGSTVLDTAWAILILQTTIFPVEVAVTVPACAWTTGYEVRVDYSVERFEVDGTLTIYEDGIQIDQVLLTDFMGSATYTNVIASDTTGARTWRAVLAVTTEAGFSVTVESSDSVTVYEAPVVGDIPDQLAPFTPGDLDDYLTVDPVATVVWTASGNEKLVVTIDQNTHVATITNPKGSSTPETITFTATASVCIITTDASDSAIFTPNRPPDVSQAAADPSCLWPSNNKFLDVHILGVTDPDEGDTVTITIDKITSDEATATEPGAAGAKHAPDAQIVKVSGQDDFAQLRAERSGLGDGRVYEITFTANNKYGATAASTVQVFVPHDMSTQCTAIDSDQNYDATAIN